MLLVASEEGTDTTAARVEEARIIVTKIMKLQSFIPRGFAMVYNQCFDLVKTKLQGLTGWEATQTNQTLHKLINTIKRICVGFNDHYQGVYTLV